ncbi:MAG: hypothetical protein AAFO07_12265 [Bacteroidota bacterium]
MTNRKLIASIFIILALVLGGIFYTQLVFPTRVNAYMRLSFLGQFGSIAICVELLAAGINLFIGHKKTNFLLALFGFTAFLDPIFSLLGLFGSNTPLYATVLFLISGGVALWIAFKNVFKLEALSKAAVVMALVLGVAVEFFFNALFK